MISPLKITGISLVLAVCGGNNFLAGLVFILAGLIATYSTWGRFNNAITHVAFFMPQQMLLFISMIGSVQAIVEGHFPLGEHVSPLFIFVDQIYLVVLCFFHIFAIILGYGLRQVVKFV